MVPSRPIITLVLLCAATVPRAATAHPISVTDAFVYVSRDKAAVQIDVFVEDLFLFHNLQPNDQDFLEPDVVREGVEKHKQFLIERFVIRDVDGQRLTGHVVKVKDFPLEPEGIALGDLMVNKLSYELEYPLDAPPEFLTFSQHLVDEKLLVPAEMRLRIKQENAGTAFQEMLYPDTPQTVRFSWENPPLTEDASQEEWEAWYAQQKEETLGITSYSALYSFLYIEDFEVRHEVLVPLLTLEASVLIARANDNFLEVAEQEAAREQITAFFTSGNPLEIDGVVVKPRVQRIDFYGLDFKDFARAAEPRRVSMANARVGIILSYSTKGTPGTVKVTWDRWNKYIWAVQMIVYAFEETSQAVLSRVGMENTYKWQNPGRPSIPALQQVDVDLPPRPQIVLPTASIVLAATLPWGLILLRRRGAKRGALIMTGGLILVLCLAAWPLARVSVPSPWAPAPQIGDQQAAAVFAGLHKNIYRAFDYRDESDIYDALAKSVDGPLLEQLYLQIRGGLEMEEQGGAVARIREVQIVQDRRTPVADEPRVDERAFGLDCRWTVAGTVEHWGHVHWRTNEYEADFVVQPRAGAWKITDVALRNEKRVRFETKLRGL